MTYLYIRGSSASAWWICTAARWAVERPVWRTDGMPEEIATVIDRFYRLRVGPLPRLIPKIEAVHRFLFEGRFCGDDYQIYTAAFSKLSRSSGSRGRYNPDAKRKKTDWSDLHALSLMLLLIDVWLTIPANSQLKTMVNDLRPLVVSAVDRLMAWQKADSHGDAKTKGFKDAEQEESKADVNTDLARIAAATDGDCWVIDGALAGSSIALMKAGVAANRIVAVNRDPITGLLILYHQLLGGGRQTRVLIGEFGDHASTAPMQSISLLYHDGCTDLPHDDLNGILAAGVLSDDAYLAVTMTKRSRGGFGRVVPTRPHGKTGSTETRLELLTELFPAHGLEFDADDTIDRHDVVVFRGRLVPPKMAGAPAVLKRRRTGAASDDE